MTAINYQKRIGKACVFVCAAALLVTVAACERKPTDDKPTASKPTTTKNAEPVVYTTFYPTTYFTNRIAGEHVHVVCPCPPDADPAYWTPDAETIGKYQSADLIVINGAAFEKWPQKVSLPESRIVDTAKPLHDEWIVMEGAVTHSHGPGGAHTHTGVDGHTWLDPVNCMVQAGVIRDALIQRYPDHKGDFEAGFSALQADLDALDARFKKLAPKVEKHFLLASHPAYNYVARRYGWHQKPFELDPEEMPDDATIAKIKAFLDQQPSKLMLWESEPDKAIATRFSEELKVESMVFSPVESLDDTQVKAGQDFIRLMNDNLDRLEKALGA